MHIDIYYICNCFDLFCKYALIFLLIIWFKLYMIYVWIICIKCMSLYENDGLLAVSYQVHENLYKFHSNYKKNIEIKFNFWKMKLKENDNLNDFYSKVDK